MAEKAIVEQHFRNADVFEATPETASPPAGQNTSQQNESSESSMNTAHEDTAHPSTSYGAHLLRYKSNRSIASSVPRKSDVDDLFRILSKRTTRSEIKSNANYQTELEEIMGGIFGRSDDDISKQKNVGVIWKHLTVLPSPSHFIDRAYGIGQRCRRRRNHERNFWRNILASLQELVSDTLSSKSCGKYPAQSTSRLLGMCQGWRDVTCTWTSWVRL